MPEIHISIDARALREAMAKAPTKVTAELHQWVSRGVHTAERVAKNKIRGSVSIGASGRTMNSITTTVKTLEGKAEPTVEYSEWVENGRRPGKMPPFQPGSDLAMWARRTGMNPFLVARSIARKGTKGKKFMEKTYKEVKPQIENDANSTLDKIVRSI